MDTGAEVIVVLNHVVPKCILERWPRYIKFCLKENAQHFAKFLPFQKQVEEELKSITNQGVIWPVQKSSVV